MSRKYRFRVRKKISSTLREERKLVLKNNLAVARASIRSKMADELGSIDRRVSISPIEERRINRSVKRQKPGTKRYKIGIRKHSAENQIIVRPPHENNDTSCK